MSLSAQADMSVFRLSMLINDKRYRSYTFQFLALMVLICLMAFLGWNLMQNLAAAGLNISYSFLGEPAGYDINQRLIEYNSQSTHWRASVVGVLNTLLVAVLGCLMATIFGVIAGVLRLSNNWIVAKIMAVYVEIFRNIPVLIWILIINALFLAALPQPRAFRGDNPEATMLFDAFAFTGRSQINAAFAARGLKPEVVLSAIDADIIKTYVGLGLGIGIVASMAYDEEADRGLRSIDAGHLFPDSTTGIALPRGAYLRGYAYSFIESVAPQLTSSVVTRALARS